MTISRQKNQRRAFLKNSVRLLASATLMNQAPLVYAKKKYQLRITGTHVTLREDLKRKAEEDLGIELIFNPGGSAQVMHQAATRPETFDVYEQWSDSINVLWQAKTIKPIDIKRIRYWNHINELSKHGKLTKDAKYGAGDAPYKLLWVQNDGSLGQRESQQISFLPYVHNADSIGYNANVISQGVPYETESWAWLLDDAHRGKVAIVNAPTIGIFDLALAVQAKGLMTFSDLGSMTRSEIDRLFEIAIEYKKSGHFRGVWSSVPQSVEYMERDGVVVESMFSPGVSDLNGRGIPCIYAAPKEGYRAWHGVMCLSSRVEKTVEDVAYEYMNWWLSGWPGAFIARQGYYISTPSLSKSHMSADEWNYWYMGKPTQAPLKNTQGRISIEAGSSRTGGSYEKRFSNVAVWNTVMDTYEYSLYKWREFVLS